MMRNVVIVSRRLVSSCTYDKMLDLISKYDVPTFSVTDSDDFSSALEQTGAGYYLVDSDCCYDLLSFLHEATKRRVRRKQFHFSLIVDTLKDFPRGSGFPDDISYDVTDIQYVSDFLDITSEKFSD